MVVVVTVVVVVVVVSGSGVWEARTITIRELLV
eukprot:COSAG02_NODE_29210_length_574_cov_0.618947_1_plen_32_part_01